MRTHLSCCLSIVLLSGLLYSQAGATHLRAGEITVERDNCDDLTFRITITVYLNAASVLSFGGEDSILEFGDGNSILVPETPTIPRPDLGVNVGMAVFSVVHSYTASGGYTINFSEANRNAGVINISEAAGTRFGLSTYINTTFQSGCNNFPALLIPPVDRACSGVAFFHNPGAYDSDGDSLSYELTIPARDGGQLVTGYMSPDDPRFYPGNNSSNEDGTGLAIFSINPVTGLITWDAAGMQGEYNVAFKVIEWRKHPQSQEWEIVSYIVRDMQIVVEDCSNRRPDMVVPLDTCIVAGSVLEATIFGIDPDNHPVMIEAFSTIFDLEENPATYTPSPPVFVPSSPAAELKFLWQTTCEQVRSQAFQVVFKITDQPPNGPKLVTYKTWRIRVIAPPPDFQSIDPDFVDRHATLHWNSAGCEITEKIQIWRRVDSFTFDAGPCETGMPLLSGYELIDEVNAGLMNFQDTNGGRRLSAGAKYCYRLVAVLPSGQLSQVSNEICIGPILVDAPVITHVTVEETDYENGSIRVSWRSPFEISKEQFPEPYQYEVFRGAGFETEGGLINISGRISDTTFLDAGIDTQDQVYNYTIVLYSQTQNNTAYSAIDTSANASSVKLLLTPGDGAMELRWEAVTPWSNHSQQYPYHLIYRGTDGNDDELVLIDSVDVMTEGYYYHDKGIQGVSLDADVIYCYQIMTRGVYGNPDIDEPLENLSPTVCSYPVNNLLPCAPAVSIVKTDCSEYVNAPTCAATQFTNSLSWEQSDLSGCRKDIRFYNVYASSDLTGEYELIASGVRDNFFVEDNLISQARCYRVAAVDQSGHESPLSEPICNDNCPYYALPNVFTPNGDGCNDTFSAFYDPEVYGGGEENVCAFMNVLQCPRFVKSVKFRVFNRWGQEVYNYHSDNDRSIYIEWDGHDNSGSLLDPAVYYYTADVSFDVIDPSERKKTFKGWVHLIR